MNDKPLRVLVVDDEAAMRRGISVCLTARGYTVDEARTGEEALGSFHDRQPDLVLLDINMPGVSGIEVCRRIRVSDTKTGIVMITVRDTEEDTIRALEAGADDYIRKPFRIGEMLARLAALTRRARTQEPPPVPVITVGDLELDLEHRVLRKKGEEVHLSPIEFSLLRYLMQNLNVPVHHTKLLRAVWGLEYGQELEYLRTYIRLIRKKIEEDPAHPEYIVTEPWLGYRFRDPFATQSGRSASRKQPRVPDAALVGRAV
jgi:two-component system, OmpR family, KDP operon response regulator KdpE